MFMKRAGIILIFCFIGIYPLLGQALEFGIQYIPIQATNITFDQDYIIFSDYSSLKILEPAFRMSSPSLSNSGLFMRYNRRHISFQTGLNFQNNVYFYGKKTYDYMTSFASLFYSSIDIPLTVAYTFRRDEKLKFRILAGVNNKIFKIRRNYYSVFSKKFDYLIYTEATASEKEKRNFMIDKINPFIVYFRSGIGIKYYNLSADLCLDRNLTAMNRYVDKYNANLKDTYQINLVLGFSIAPKDLKYKKFKGKINKE
jgi:hypothetical protein